MNLSQQKRERLLNFIKELKQNNSFDEKSLIELNEIENELNGKKYGLVWEEHEEAVDIQMKEAVPVFVEDKSKEIVSDKDEPFNFLLEGDNLHSLYLLEKTHKGKIDVIYIDPPYNTGKEFIYNDNKIGSDDGYRHSKWISFMKNRLLIAKSLLTQGGIIFISIDDNEAFNLKLLLDSIFGESNFLANIMVKANPRGRQSSTYFAQVHDYLLVYRKSNLTQLNGFKLDEETIKRRFKHIDENGRPYEEWELRKRGAASKRIDVPNLYYPIYYNEKTKLLSLEKTKNSIEITPHLSTGEDGRWRWGKEKFNQSKDTLYARKNRDGFYNVYEKKFIEDKNEQLPPTIWDYQDINTELGTEALKETTHINVGFNYPKPVGLIKRCICLVKNKNTTVLDFFAGSGTAAQAVLELNNEDGGNRKFILCTNNENKICEEVTLPRVKAIITGKRDDGSKYSDGLPANLKYFKTDFVSKSSKNLSKELTKHVKELIELEWGVSIDKKVNIMVLSEEELDKIEVNWDKLKTTVKSIYRARQVVYTGKQKQLFKNINNFIIPDYYFNNELKEVGENW